MRAPYAQTLKHRAEWSFCILAGCFLVLSIRMLDIQVRQHARFRAMADRYHVRHIRIEAARGLLRDRNGNNFTQNVVMPSVFVDPRLIEDPAVAARQLAPLLGRDPVSLEATLRQKRSFIWLKRKLDPQTEKAIKDLNLRGIDFAPETRRTYPLKTLAANLIGFADIDGKGIEGLEHQLQQTIAGKPGALVAEVDALGRVIPGTNGRRTEAVDGYTVGLTIDSQIQHLAEQAVEKAYRSFQAAAVCAVVLDPRTGEILALANRPTYDPNHPSDSTSDQRRNRCVTDQYEPGSTMKSITVAAALEEHAITPSSTFYCGGVYPIGKNRIHCVLHGAEYKNGHGSQTIRGILRESCNIGSAQIGARLGAIKLYRYIADFGFIGDTSAGILGERRGMLDPPDTWQPIRLANVAFGQGVAVTPLQMATAYAAIANGGKLMQPYLLRRVEDSAGKVITEYQPHEVRQVISPETARTVTDCLKGVVEEGTGKPAAVPGYSVAGKTGSAQKVAKNGHGFAPGCFEASFAGFAPADNPRVVALVVVDEPKGSHWGATTAAPVFKEIVQGALWTLKVPPDRPADLEKPKAGKHA